MLSPILNLAYSPNALWAALNLFPPPHPPPDDYFFTIYTTKRSSGRLKKKITALKRRARRSWTGSGEQVVEPAGCNVGWAEPGTCLLPPVHSAAFQGLPPPRWRGAQGHPSLLPPAPPRQRWVLSSQHGLVAPWRGDVLPVPLAEPAGISGSLAGVPGGGGEAHRAGRFLCSCASGESLSVKWGKRWLRAQLVTYGTRPLP